MAFLLECLRTLSSCRFIPDSVVLGTQIEFFYRCLIWSYDSRMFTCENVYVSYVSSFLQSIRFRLCCESGNIAHLFVYSALLVIRHVSLVLFARHLTVIIILPFACLPTWQCWSYNPLFPLSNFPPFLSCARAVFNPLVVLSWTHRLLSVNTSVTIDVFPCCSQLVSILLPTNLFSFVASARRC